MENKVLVNDTMWLITAKDLYNVQQDIKNLEQKASDLAHLLKELSNQEPKSFGGMKYAYFTRAGSIDYSLIPELKGLELEQYRKAPVKAWKLEIERI
jgi:hypothetical protein